jgi:hypothetical protein
VRIKSAPNFSSYSSGRVSLSSGGDGWRTAADGDTIPGEVILRVHYSRIRRYEALTRLEDAVTRPGRCVANVGFRELVADDIARGVMLEECRSWRASEQRSLTSTPTFRGVSTALHQTPSGSALRSRSSPDGSSGPQRPL